MQCGAELVAAKQAARTGKGRRFACCSARLKRRLSFRCCSWCSAPSPSKTCSNKPRTPASQRRCKILRCVTDCARCGRVLLLTLCHRPGAAWRSGGVGDGVMCARSVFRCTSSRSCNVNTAAHAPQRRVPLQELGKAMIYCADVCWRVLTCADVC